MFSYEKNPASDINPACFFDFTAGIDPVAIAVEDHSEEVHGINKFAAFSVFSIVLVKRTEIQVLYQLFINEDFIIGLEPFCHIDREEKLLCLREKLPVIVMKV